MYFPLNVFMTLESNAFFLVSGLVISDLNELNGDARKYKTSDPRK